MKQKPQLAKLYHNLQNPQTVLAHGMENKLSPWISAPSDPSVQDKSQSWSNGNCIRTCIFWVKNHWSFQSLTLSTNSDAALPSPCSFSSAVKPLADKHQSPKPCKYPFRIALIWGVTVLTACVSLCYRKLMSLHFLKFLPQMCFGDLWWVDFDRKKR